MQRARVNAIREVHTVAGSDGTTYQVDTHHERYFVNKRDNTYIETDATTERHGLRRSYGVNPDDYKGGRSSADLNWVRASEVPMRGREAQIPANLRVLTAGRGSVGRRCSGCS